MKLVVFVSIALLPSCSGYAGCPSVERLAKRDAVADARASLAHGDRHLLMLGGYVGEAPGVTTVGTHPTQMMAGTSDTETADCSRTRPIAEAYATKYNKTVIAADEK